MIRNQRHTLSAALFWALYLSVFAGMAHAQSAASEVIETPVIASGGGDMLGAGSEEVNATIGQPLTPDDTLVGVDNETVWIGFWSVLPSDPSSVREERIARSVRTTGIASAAPNPFTDRVAFELDLAESAHVVLTVHDPLGREIARLVDGQRAIGAHRVTWRPDDLPAGTFFVRLEIDGTTRGASPIQHYK